MSENEPFFKIFKKDVLAFGAQEAVIIAFISEFEARNMKCWVSRKYIAERVGMSEATAQRKIDKLVKVGALIRSTMDGRRLLETAPDRWECHPFDGDSGVALANHAVSN